MKVIDSFSFFNEFEILKLRIEYLKDIVDTFVIVESNYTYSGDPKPYYLDQIIHELPREKIVSIHYEPDISSLSFGRSNLDMTSDFWKLERSQRQYITDHLDQFNPDDLFMVSDVDEIPNKDLIKHIKSHNVPQDFCASVECEMFYYNFATKMNCEWRGTVISTIQNAKEKGCDYFRANRNNIQEYKKGGWHFSYFGDVNRIQHKIKSFAHQEFNTSQINNSQNIIDAIQNKKDLLRRGETFIDYSFDDFPDDLKNSIISVFR